jgi:hypothetical protein
MAAGWGQSRGSSCGAHTGPVTGGREGEGATGGVNGGGGRRAPRASERSGAGSLPVRDHQGHGAHRQLLAGADSGPPRWVLAGRATDGRQAPAQP